MMIWMYFRTDGDCGYYAIRLFYKKKDAIAYMKSERSAYGNIEEIEIH